MAVLFYPTDRLAYARLCRLLSLGKKRAGKAKCTLHWSDIALLVPDEAEDTCAFNLRRLHEVFGDRAYLALTRGVGRMTPCTSSNSQISPFNRASL
jgi:error-prone DNA polymerase